MVATITLLKNDKYLRVIDKKMTKLKRNTNNFWCMWVLTTKQTNMTNKNKLIYEKCSK